MRKRSKKSKVPQQATSVAYCSLHVVVSVGIFSASVLVFIHQCVRPFSSSHRSFLRNVRRSSSYHRTVTRPRLNASAASQPHKWFSYDASDGGNVDSANEGSAPPSHHLTKAESVEAIPEGPVPLPDLHNATGNVTLHDSLSAHSSSGSSWTGSFAQGVLSALPLHWVAEVIHSAPRKEDVSGEERDSAPSIFSARRKGAWIGCSHPFHLVCKGVYRAIKIMNVVNVVDVSCERNVDWLPHILLKLKTEFRLVHLTCAVKSQEVVDKVEKGYEGVERVKIVVLDGYKDKFPNGTDMVIAYRYLARGTLIDAMRFFKNVKASGTVGLLAMENYPEQSNRQKRMEENTNIGISNNLLRLNVALAPFGFARPVYEYENMDENPDYIRMSICTYKVEEMFEGKSTPQMKDLVDPRKRHVLE